MLVWQHPTPGTNICIYQTFKEEITNLFQRIEKVGIISRSFYEVSITLTPKPNKNLIREEYYRFITINIGPKILVKILEHQTQQCIKNVNISPASWNVNLIWYYKINALLIINKTKEKIMKISVDTKSVFDKIQLPFITKKILPT